MWNVYDRFVSYSLKSFYGDHLEFVVFHESITVLLYLLCIGHSQYDDILQGIGMLHFPYNLFSKVDIV